MSHLGPSQCGEDLHHIIVNKCVIACEDSLLATPLILDLSILGEFLTCVKYRDVKKHSEIRPLYPALSLLSFMLKVPLVKPSTDVFNSLSRQRNGLEAFLKACLGIENSEDLILDTRLW
ncbi:INO1_1 [Sanghuangporus vaninii]